MSSEMTDRTGIFCLTHGDLVIRWPEHLTPNDCEDALEYLALVTRQMKRRADRCPYVSIAGTTAEALRPTGEER